jgi:hypothetical protein
MNKSRIALSLGLTLALAAPIAPASAQGLFEALFGGLRQAARTIPTEVSSYSDPFSGMRRGIDPSEQRSESGPSSGFCVRTCDGHYFPVHAQAGVSAAQMCHSFCPASETKLYSGSKIDYAVSTDGSRYSDLPAAFAYRQKIVAGCTCNGRTAFGLAPVDVKTDPTLRQGDIVATRGGLTVFTGSKNKTANFTPIEDSQSMSKAYRDKLADMKIMPPNPNAPAVTPVSLVPQATRRDDNRRVQNDR